MSLDVAIAAIVLLDVALIGFLAFMMSLPAKLTPHRHAPLPHARFLHIPAPQDAPGLLTVAATDPAASQRRATATSRTP